ncbi:sodium:calcium antiporter [Maribacter arcticus]|uniref:Cation:H+ antiporter n=1 Tax=Maribacter arcticus TaxID=561365 RepID=A0A1T5CHI2_9FLAO|nr:sodium:calcium antiporter [Maribacter arcticus]SKB58907.1 cation:H+ antiporter [Maribacter arcticus]
MNSIVFDIAGFALCAGVILISGSKLSKYGDMMADMLGWGKMFMGLVLMASVTSMPELMTGFSSVVLVDAPNLAVGDIVGSCAFNILIISIMDMFYNKKKPLTSDVQPGHIISASFGIMMLSVVAVAILMPGVFGSIAWVGGSSIVFISIYLVAIRVLYLYEKKQHIQHIFPSEGELTLKQVITKYVINALIVMGAALALPYFGEHLAVASGLGQSFFGTLFIAASTSLPEIVVSVTAIRIGTIDLAIGNIFGSNIFNIGILALDDILYTKGPLLLDTSPNHIIPVLGTIIITAIGITGIVYRAEKKWKLALDTALILIVFVLMMFLLYHKTNIAI